MPTPIPTSTRTPRLMIGAMSGTSADGVDAALVEITGRGLDMQVTYRGHVERPYNAELRKRIFALRESGACRLDELARLGREITLAYAAAVKDLLAQESVEASQVQATAAHGQTLYHEVPDTIQWLDPSLLAAQTGIAVVSDFRRADLAAGGQGAPLVPFADWILFRHPEKTRVILNIGGIANLTYLPAGGGIDEVIAFDTGPGNCISDWLMRKHDPAGPGYDEDGEQAWVTHQRLLEPQPADEELTERKRFQQLQHFLEIKLDRHDYFTRRPPKSTDTAEMLDIFASALAEASGADVDRVIESGDIGILLYAATDLTVRSVHRALHKLRSNLPHHAVVDLFVAGGGARHRLLMHYLGFENPLWHFKSGGGAFQTTDEAGLPSQARESVAFAVMGAATLDGEPSNVPSATGAKKRVVLGSITPRP